MSFLSFIQRAFIQRVLASEPARRGRSRSGKQLQVERLEERLVLSATLPTVLSALHAVKSDVNRLAASTPALIGKASLQGDAAPAACDCQSTTTGSLAWEKRDTSGNLLGGATFQVGPINPLDGGATPLTVVDNGANDADPDAGQILVNNVAFGTYTITETVPPAGFALDVNPSRTATVSASHLNAVVGSPLGSAPGTDDAGSSNSSDFHDAPLPTGSIEWEKRNESNVLQGGATFTVVNAGKTFHLTVVDNGANDTDPDAGQIKVVNIPQDNYTVTETVAPAGYALDDDATRAVTVSAGNLNAVIGSPLGSPPGIDDPGNTNQSDFHNLLGSIEWEKRNENNLLQGGATFTVVNEGNTFNLTVVDNGVNDTDPDAGQIKVINIPLDTYTVTETVPPVGYAVDDDPTRSVIVKEGNLSAEIGSPLGSAPGIDDPGNTNESDFHDPPLEGSTGHVTGDGSIEWEKRDQNNVLQGGAKFTVNSDALNLTVIDNGVNDTDPDAGQIKVIDLPLGAYTVTEVKAPAGYALDDDPTRGVTVSAGNLHAVIGSPLGSPPGTDDPGNTNQSDFHNRLGSIEWEKRNESNDLQGGATFTVVNTGKTFSLTVVDNGANDADPDAGQIKVINIPLDTYTVTETVPPVGYAVDADPTRSVTVREGNLSAEIGSPLGVPPGTNDPGHSNESDFHDAPLAPTGSLSWEKRDNQGHLLGGATFTVGPTNPLTGASTPLTVVDNGVNDADPIAGSFKVNLVLFGTYTVTETVAPAGYAIDKDLTRLQTVNANNLNAVIGAQGVNNAGTSNESDFHDCRLRTPPVVVCPPVCSKPKPVSCQPIKRIVCNRQPAKTRCLTVASERIGASHRSSM
ncbi:MAG: hypothetical protein K8T25_08935 [Planctomycetia bacterium]|nr:hypothetical protein [Planctomycetia bacterium]